MVGTPPSLQNWRPRSAGSQQPPAWRGLSGTCQPGGPGGAWAGPPPDLCRQRRAPLQRQLVQGDVVIAEPQCRLQPPGPGVPALPRQPEEEVDGGSAGEEPPRRLHGPPRLRRRVLPTQQPQLCVVQRLWRERSGSGGARGAVANRTRETPSHLDADGEAVDASFPEAGEARCAGRAGVGLQRDLGAGREVGSPRDGLQHRCDGAGAGQAGGAPSEEDGGDAVGQRVERLRVGAEGPRTPQPETSPSTHLCTWLRWSRVRASRTRQARTAASSTAGTTYLLKLQ